MEIGLSHYLTLAAILFTVGIFGIFLNRKNVIIILMSIELMLNAVNINLIAFSHHLRHVGGQVFAIFVIMLAAAEAAIALAIRIGVELICIDNNPAVIGCVHYTIIIVIAVTSITLCITI
mgnify:CR=1 FL=1